VVEIQGLVKRVGNGVLAVAGLDLVVGKGQVLGLAGPNGSGKTMTLKVLLGLVRPTAGRVLLFGEAVRPGARVLGRVGALIDGPGFVPHLSGLDNLKLGWRLTRRPAAEAGLERALQMAGLGDAIHRPYRTYSHGMRYRLGFAQALLGRPDLVILDEPLTGLDPLHVLEVRAAVAGLARAGATVLMSSHVLSEVEQVCTHAAVLQRGRLVASGPLADLVGSVDGVQLQVDDRLLAVEALRALWPIRCISSEGRWLRVESEGLRPAALFTALDSAGVQVYAFRAGRSLEDAYVELVRGPASKAGAGDSAP
jgi:ABC-2 type transport system ATP-binding protein